MSIKKFSLLLCGVISISLICTGCFSKKNIEPENEIIEKNVSKPASTIQKKETKSYDLYSETPYDLPLVSIAEISKLPENIKKTVDSILESSQGFYYLKVNNDSVFIILQNPIAAANTYSRHNLQFIEIDKDGAVTSHLAGYVGIDGEIGNTVSQKKNDIWVFDETIEPYRPVKHTNYDEKGKIKFVETWSYDDTEPVKYQMKDANKKIVSILKESQDNDANLRREHIFYDNEGKTTMSLTVNYDGANISRLTYYNSHDKIDSVSILSEYENGHKVKELIYNEDYELINTAIADYIDEERKSIQILDKNNNEILKISS